MQNSNQPERFPFRPINQGLGLDHFSDGLPYASQKKATTATSTTVSQEMLLEIKKLAEQSAQNQHQSTNTVQAVETQAQSIYLSVIVTLFDLTIAIALGSLVSLLAFFLNDIPITLIWSNQFGITAPLIGFQAVFVTTYFLLFRYFVKLTPAQVLFRAH